VADPKNLPAFPRAELGLPIIFHFKDPADSPNNSELYPKGKTRMASPIILRPLAIGEGDRAVAMVLRLTTPPLEELELKKITDPPVLNASNIYRPDLAQYTNSPLGSPISGGPKRSSNGSALDAFIGFAKEKGFQERTP
jgi:CRISPR-associated protein Cmr1